MSHRLQISFKQAIYRSGLLARPVLQRMVLAVTRHGTPTSGRPVAASGTIRRPATLPGLRLCPVSAAGNALTRHFTGPVAGPSGRRGRATWAAESRSGRCCAAGQRTCHVLEHPPDTMVEISQTTRRPIRASTAHQQPQRRAPAAGVIPGGLRLGARSTAPRSVGGHCRSCGHGLRPDQLPHRPTPPRHRGGGHGPDQLRGTLRCSRVRPYASHFDMSVTRES